jgi:sugar lactone lactonase YvrE
LSVAWEVVVSDLSKLEAPCADPDGNLYFSELTGAGYVYRLGTDGMVRPLIAGRPRVGGIVLHADGGLVVGGAQVSVWRAGRERVVLDAGTGYVFNDLTTDREGRLYVGRLGVLPADPPVRPPGALWSLDRDGVVRSWYDDIGISNGMGVSPDGRSLYYIDTSRDAVFACGLLPDGTVKDRRLFYQFEPGARPDGMAIDEHGFVIVAAAKLAALIRIGPDGRLAESIEVDGRYIASLCFGETDRHEVFVTTFGDPYDVGRTGCVLRGRMDVPGLSVPPATI